MINKQHIVKENALLREEHDILLQKVERMRIELTASRKRNRKLMMGQGKDHKKISSL